jgi:hypothetical protein
MDNFYLMSLIALQYVYLIFCMMFLLAWERCMRNARRDDSSFDELGTCADDGGYFHMI